MCVLVARRGSTSNIDNIYERNDANTIGAVFGLQDLNGFSKQIPLNAETGRVVMSTVVPRTHDTRDTRIRSERKKLIGLGARGRLTLTKYNLLFLY